MIKNIIFAFFIILYFANSSYASNCNNISISFQTFQLDSQLDSYQNLNPTEKKTLNDVVKLNWYSLSKKQTTSQKDITEVQDLVTEIKRAGVHGFFEKDDYQNYITFLENLPSYQLREEVISNWQSSYAPDTELDNNRIVLLSKLHLLNEVLPKKLRKKIPDYPKESLRKFQIEKAKNNVAKLEKVLQKRLKESHDDLDIYKVMKESNNENIREIAEVFEKGDLKLLMRAKKRARDSIANKGFLNTYETLSTGGSSTPNRSLSESRQLFASENVQAYEDSDHAIKPKYGYIDTGDNVAKKIRNAVDQYGDDIYHFKKDQIKDRTTMTAGDSLAIHYYGKVKKKVKDSWATLYIPWEKREIAAAYVVPRPGDESKYYIGYDKGNVKGFDRGESNDGMYLEAQYHGPLDLNNVEKFEFTETPPEGDFLQTLKEKNIIILDGRDQENVIPWNE